MMMFLVSGHRTFIGFDRAESYFLEGLHTSCTYLLSVEKTLYIDTPYTNMMHIFMITIRCHKYITL